MGEGASGGGKGQLASVRLQCIGCVNLDAPRVWNKPAELTNFGLFQDRADLCDLM